MRTTSDTCLLYTSALPAGEDLEALGAIGVGANLPLRRDIAEDAVKFLPGVHLRFGGRLRTGGRLRAGAPVRVRAFRWLGALARLRRRLDVYKRQDQDYASNEDEVGALYSGFLHLERPYYKVTGEHLPFVPLC